MKQEQIQETIHETRLLSKLKSILESSSKGGGATEFQYESIKRMKAKTVF